MTRARVVVAILTLASTAEAQRVRRRFEPTDLRLTPQGVAEIDLQGGYLHGSPSDHVFAPDVEASLGISSRAELEIDTTYGFEDGKPMFLDDTWTSLRVGIVDIRAEGAAEAAWAAGIQAGPKLPTAPSSRTLGAEWLVIAGRNVGRYHVFFQIGGLLDPKDLDAGGARPYGLEGGVDLDLDLDDVDRWSVKAELGGVRFFSPHADQIHATGGVAYKPIDWLELSLVAVGGILKSGDKYGLLFGASPSFKAF